MSLEDKAKNAATEFAGKAKEGVGDLTGDEQLKTEGKVDQAKATAAQKAEEIKDAAAKKAGDVADKAKGLIDGLKK